MKSFKYIHQLFDERVKNYPEDVFLETLDQEISYAQLSEQVDLLEGELKRHSVRSGDRVLIIAENCVEHVALILAISRVGAWSCGINARMSKGEIATFVKKADPRIIYFTSQISSHAKERALEYAATPSVLPNLSKSKVFEDSKQELGELAEKVAAIIFTSGTTGGPKGVLVSHPGLIKFGEASAKNRQLSSSDKAYAYVPMTHIFGLGTVLMSSLYSGSKLLMRHAFDPGDVFDSLANKGLSNLQGPPTLYVRLLSWLEENDIQNPPCPNLRYVYTGAAPLDMVLKRRVEEVFKQPLHHGYGLSEYAGALTLVERGINRADTSAGYVIDGGEVRIVDENGQDLPPNQKGEIWMRGIGLMPGYFRDEVATASVIKPGGWYASGDVGYLAEDGALFVVGRLKEMIIRSGFNVYPGEVEACINGFGDIEKCAVVGKKESDGNEEVWAFIQPKAGRVIDEQDLKKYMADNLAPYKRPAKIVFVEDFPMTHSGKILKRLLIEG